MKFFAILFLLLYGAYTVDNILKEIVNSSRLNVIACSGIVVLFTIACVTIILGVA